MTTSRPQLYKFRAVHIGPTYWNCPYCGHMNLAHLSWQSFVSHCTACRVKLAFGVHGMVLRKGARTDILPPDMRVIDDRGELPDPHPEADLTDYPEWIAHAKVHKLSD